MGRALIFFILLLTISFLYQAYAPSLKIYLTGYMLRLRRIFERRRQAKAAPDDDEDFLWQLKTENYRRKNAQKQPQNEEPENANLEKIQKNTASSSSSESTPKQEKEEEKHENILRSEDELDGDTKDRPTTSS